MTDLTLRAATRAFQSARAGLVSEATEAWYASRLRRLCDEVGDVPLCEVALPDLWAWRASLVRQKSRWSDNPHVRTRQGGLSRSTIDGHIRAVKAFFAWCVDKKLICENPAADLDRVKVPDIPPKWVTPEAVVALLRVANRAGPRATAIVRLLAFSGLRVGELVALRRADVELKLQRAHIRHGKGGKYRVVYFDLDTAKALYLYMKRVRKLPDFPLFWGRQGPLTDSGIRQILSDLCKEAGLPRISPHRLRHTFANQSAKRGVDPDKLRRQLGHSNVATTYNSYIRWQFEDLAGAFEDPWLEEEGSGENGKEPPTAPAKDS